jgi:hypothetical protein
VRFGGEVVRAAGRFAEDDEAIVQKKRDGKKKKKTSKKGNLSREETEDFGRLPRKTLIP